jgi:2-C-methyl-D-erythritol 2,4-cyclodiphosphate synthase
VRVGQGIDAHPLVPGRRLRLGGVEIPHDRGLDGHSDGDVLLHAVASALLGALGEGDLGRHFPSSDPALAGIDSGEILSRVAVMVRERGFAPHLELMRSAIADRLGVACERVNVKVTSTDRLGAIGRGEGIAAQAVALLERA